MSLNPQLIYMSPFEIQLWDKDLNVPLAAGVVTFYEDKNHSVKKSVWQLVGDGMGTYSYVELPNPLTLSSIGTFVDGNGINLQVYMYPYIGSPNDVPNSQTVDLYYITVVSSTNIPQFTVNAWPPGLTPGGLPTNAGDTTDNIISNSQFVNVLFDSAATSASPVTFSTTGTGTITEIAPDWSIITTGTGTFSVYQQAISDTSAITNPPVALGITSTGYSLPIQLRQRLFTPRIFSGNFVSGTFIAEATDGGSYTLTMSYVPSATGTPQAICTGTTPATGFGQIANTTAVLIAPPNSGAAPSAYVDIIITIPVNAPVQISSIQLCGVATASESVTYLQNTPAQEINGLFHYYQPRINFKEIPSLLTAWDFTLNPAQFGATKTIHTTPGYIWDQTICASAVNDMNVSAVSFVGDFLVIPTAGNDAFYMLQYLSGQEAIKTTFSNLAVNISAYSLVNPGVVARVYLFYSTGGGTIPILPNVIGTIDTSGVFSLDPVQGANWAAIPQFSGASSSGVVPESASGAEFDLKFNEWNGRFNFGGAINNNFAIVVTFHIPTPIPQLVISSISLTPGDIPTRPAPQTVDEVLRECQYYYETSDISSAGTYIDMNSLSIAGSTSAYAYVSPFQLNYMYKRAAPIITIASQTATIANVSAVLNYINGSTVYVTTSPADKALTTFWNTPSIGLTRAVYLPKPSITPNLVTVSDSSASTANSYSSAFIYFTYTLDSRLGAV